MATAQTAESDCPLLPASAAPEATTDMRPARTADGGAPQKRTKEPIDSNRTTAETRRRAPIRDMTIATSSATIAM